MGKEPISDALHFFVFNLETHYGELNKGVSVVIGADYGTVTCLLSEVAGKMRFLKDKSKTEALDLGFKLENLSFTFTFFNRID
jgi:hypothetical protein